MSQKINSIKNDDVTKLKCGRTKVRKIPDFNKIHQQWASKLEQRKALSKKPCTVPKVFDICHEKPSQKASTPKTLAAGRVSRTSNMKNGAERASVKKAKEEKSPTSSDPSIEFEASRDALESILNEKGVSDEAAASKMYSMYGRVIKDTGSSSETQPANKVYSMYSRVGPTEDATFKTPLRPLLKSSATSARNSIYYNPNKQQMDGPQSEYVQRCQSRCEGLAKNPVAVNSPLFKPALAVPIRNSVYKRYYIGPKPDLLESSPSSRKEFTTPKEKNASKSPTHTADKTAAKVKWADVLSSESPKVKASPKRLSFEESECPEVDKENVPLPPSTDIITAKTEDKENHEYKPALKNFSIYSDKELKPVSSEKPKNGALSALSPNVPTHPRARDMLHHNSPIKAAVSSKPLYYQPSKPHMENQVSCVTDLMNKENLSPNPHIIDNRRVSEKIMADILRDDVLDLSMTLNESMMMYDQLQHEADDLLLPHNQDDQVILGKLAKIKTKQEQLMKMQLCLQQQLKSKQAKCHVNSNLVSSQAKPASSQYNISKPPDVQPQASSIMTIHELQSDQESAESKQMASNETSAQHQAKVLNVTSPKIAKEEPIKVHLEGPVKASLVQKTADKPLEKIVEKKEDNLCNAPEQDIESLTQSNKDTQQNEVFKTPMKPSIKPFHEESAEVSGSNQIETPVTPVTNTLSALTVYANNIATPDFVMPTPVCASAKHVLEATKYFPAIHTPLSMKDMARRTRTSLSPRRDSLGGSPQTPEDISESYSIDKSVSSVSDASPASCVTPCRRFLTGDSPMISFNRPATTDSPFYSASPLGLLLSPRSPVRLRGSMSLAGSVHLGRPYTPRMATRLLSPAVHRFHEALLDDEVSLYMCRLHGNSCNAVDLRTQDPVAEVLSIGDEMHFIPVPHEELVLKFSLQPVEGSAFSAMKIQS